MPELMEDIRHCGNEAECFRVDQRPINQKSSCLTMQEVTMKYFLESIPPGTTVTLNDAERQSDRTIYLSVPDIEVYCDGCSGLRWFESTNSIRIGDRKPFVEFLIFQCRNCALASKKYAAEFTYHSDDKRRWRAFKYGESPFFGPRTPANAITLIGPDRELFLQGRRCENQGLGIGAFVYYRRVVENQKNRILDETIRVAKHLGCDSELIAEIDKAKTETQFTSAIAAIKHAIPQSLFVNGHNPLTLLHTALSAGVHQHSDEECLALAASVRVVLFEFAERLSNAMKEEKELQNAVKQLVAKRKPAL